MPPLAGVSPFKEVYSGFRGMLSPSKGVPNMGNPEYKRRHCNAHTWDFRVQVPLRRQLAIRKKLKVPL